MDFSSLLELGSPTALSIYVFIALITAIVSFHYVVAGARKVAAMFRVRAD